MFISSGLVKTNPTKNTVISILWNNEIGRRIK